MNATNRCDLRQVQLHVADIILDLLQVKLIQNAFRKTGVYPFDSSVIHETIFEPSRVFSNDLYVKNSGDNASGPAEDENSVVHRMADFLAKKEETLISTKLAKQLKKTERKCLSKLTSGRCITEDEVKQAIQNYKKDTSSKNAANKKQDKGPILKEKEEATRVSTVNDSQTAGASGAAVTHKPWLGDWNSEEPDIEIRQEEKCCVCKIFYPSCSETKALYSSLLSGENAMLVVTGY